MRFIDDFVDDTQIGVQVVAGDGSVLATLWQHLDRAEAQATLDENYQGSLGSILAHWSGQWEPAKPNFADAVCYELVTRIAPRIAPGVTK